MERTLLVYDLNGTVVHQVTGGYTIPNGIPYIEAIIPQGKMVKSINIESKEPVLEDIPLTEMDLMKEKINILEDSHKAILRGDMQTLAYNLYPEDFPKIDIVNPL